jgi:hypothetical protein
MSSFSASLQIVFSDNYINVSPTADEIKAHCIFKNISDSTIQVKLIYEPISIASGQEIAFCWGPICYPPMNSHFEPKDVMQLAPGEMSKENEFYLTYYPNGTEGTSTVDFTIYVVGNPEDSIHYTVTFDSRVSSVADAGNVKDYVSRVVSDKISIENLFGKRYNRIQIFNQLGVKLWERAGALPSEIEVSNFPKGVYCLVLFDGSSVIAEMMFLKE